jgi:hypothetical protein
VKIFVTFDCLIILLTRKELPMVIFSVAKGGFERSLRGMLPCNNLISSFVYVVNVGKTRCRTVRYFNSAMCGMAER